MVFGVDTDGVGEGKGRERGEVWVDQGRDMREEHCRSLENLSGPWLVSRVNGFLRRDIR